MFKGGEDFPSPPPATRWESSVVQKGKIRSHPLGCALMMDEKSLVPFSPLFPLSSGKRGPLEMKEAFSFFFPFPALHLRRFKTQPFLTLRMYFQTLPLILPSAIKKAYVIASPLLFSSPVARHEGEICLAFQRLGSRDIHRSNNTVLNYGPPFFFLSFSLSFRWQTMM